MWQVRSNRRKTHIFRQLLTQFNLLIQTSSSTQMIL